MSDFAQKIIDGYKDISDPEMAFGTTKLLAKPSEVPEELDFRGRSKWNKLFSDMFFSGITELDVVPKGGVDVAAALKCIKAHMTSWESKHEEKEAGVAFMMSVLFEDVTWTAGKIKT